MAGGSRMGSGVHLSRMLTWGWWGPSFLCWSLQWWWHLDVDQMLGWGDLLSSGVLALWEGR